MDDKYKTKAQLRAELALLRQWIHDSGSCSKPSTRENGPCEEIVNPNRVRAQLSALISASRAVFRKHSFAAVSRSVFDLAKSVIGADNGFVAMNSHDGHDIEVVFIDYGSMPDHISKKMTLPVRDLHAEVYHNRRALYVNDFENSEMAKKLPYNHVPLTSILFSPLIMKNKVVGTMAFANKRGGFDRADTEITQAFCELLSISLANTHAYEALSSSEECFRQFFQNEPNYCFIVSPDGSITDINAAGLDALGCSREELIGQPWWSIYDAESQAWIKRRHVDYEYPFAFSGQSLSIISRLGTRRYVLVSMSETRNDRGQLLHYVAVQNDVTRQVKIESEQKQLINIYQEQSAILTESNTQLEDALNKVQESEMKLHELYQHEKQLHHELETEIRKRADFTRTLVHELKTPLVPLVASASLLSEGLKEEPWVSIAANIENGATNLSQRIDELLDVAKGEVGSLKVHLKELNLVPVIDEVVRQTRDLIKVRSQVLETDIPKSLPMVKADVGRISQVITNLLSNASKYTPSSGTISMKVRIEAGYAVIAVTDTGLGIPREDQQYIFSSYYRASNSRTQYQGMGIGLYLCKIIMELHNGEISLKSEEGKGSTFILKLPVSQKTAPHDPRFPSQRILLALDEENAAERLSRSICDSWPEFETFPTASGQEAIELCQRENFDGCVLDLEITDVDGIRALRTIKAKCNIPVLALISADSHTMLLEAATRESDGVFIKPFDQRCLIKHLNKVLSLKG